VAAVTTAKTYTCTVKASNARGASLASAPSLPVVVGAPAAPTAVRAVSESTTTTSASLTVTFALGADNGSAVTSQTATCISSNGGITGFALLDGTTAGPITLVGLNTAKTYTCTVQAGNARGASLASVPSLPVVVGAPAAPTAARAVSGSTTTTTGSLRVTFALGADNGSVITSQTATCISRNGGLTRTGTHTGPTPATITVAAVTTAKTYTCTVKASNARGASLASAPSLPVVVGSPTAPTGVTATRQAAGQIKVTFISGANNGSPITGYTARCISSDGGVPNVKSGPASPLTVVSLSAGKSYTCTVTATNARGTSPASIASGATTA
jgi:titin